MLKMREKSIETADDLPGLDRALPSLVNHIHLFCYLPAAQLIFNISSEWSIRSTTAGTDVCDP